MSDDYYIAENGETKGPYSKAQLRSIWDRGLITSDAQYWTEGMDDWYLISTFMEDEREFPRPAQPPPQPCAAASSVPLSPTPRRGFGLLFVVVAILIIGAGYFLALKGPSSKDIVDPAVATGSQQPRKTTGASDAAKDPLPPVSENNSNVIRFAPLGVSQPATEAVYGNAVASEPGGTQDDYGREYHFGSLVIRVSFINGLSAMQLFEKADKSEITKAEMETIMKANGPMSEWIGPSTSVNGGLGYGNKNRQLLFAYRYESHDAVLGTTEYFNKYAKSQNVPSVSQTGIPATPREAADAYIESLRQ